MPVTVHHQYNPESIRIFSDIWLEKLDRLLKQFIYHSIQAHGKHLNDVIHPNVTYALTLVVQLLRSKLEVCREP